MLRFGKISEVDPDSGLAKVAFNEDGTTSDWMSPCYPTTNGDSFSWTLKINQQVACMMGRDQANGVILGSIYSRDVTPTDAGEDIFSVVFSNGDKIKYDKATGEMELKASGGLTVVGDLTVQGDIDSTGAIDAALDVTAGLANTSLGGHTHVYVTSAGAPANTSIPSL